MISGFLIYLNTDGGIVEKESYLPVKEKFRYRDPNVTPIGPLEKMANLTGLSLRTPNRDCGFESHTGHQYALGMQYSAQLDCESSASGCKFHPSDQIIWTLNSEEECRAHNAEVAVS